MTIVDHLRAVLATVNDKAYRSGADQDAISAARQALARFDAGEPGASEDDEPPAPQYGPMTEMQDGMARVLSSHYPLPAGFVEERSVFLKNLKRAAPVADQRAAFVKAMDGDE